MERTLKILATNWIHIVGFFITTYLSLILFKLIGIPGSEDESWTMTLFISILTIPLLYLLYGIPIIFGFYTAILTIDAAAFNFLRNKTRLILFAEWLIIIAPFINWAFEYDYWLWITLSLSFLTTQYLREKKISKILKQSSKTSRATS